MKNSSQAKITSDLKQLTDVLIGLQQGDRSVGRHGLCADRHPHEADLRAALPHLSGLQQDVGTGETPPVRGQRINASLAAEAIAIQSAVHRGQVGVRQQKRLYPIFNVI